MNPFVYIYMLLNDDGSLRRVLDKESPDSFIPGDLPALYLSALVHGESLPAVHFSTQNPQEGFHRHLSVITNLPTTP